MPEFCGPFVYATTHEFKSNISQWTRMLKLGAYKGLFVTRHGTVVGVYMTAGARSYEESIRRQYGAKYEERPEPGMERPWS